jgi:hypothetical protein
MIFGIGGLVVEDTPTGRVGLVTERDLVRTLSRKRGTAVLMTALQFELEVEKAKTRSSTGYGQGPPSPSSSSSPSSYTWP